MKLSLLCHSRMEEVIPEDAAVKWVVELVVLPGLTF